MQAASAPEGQEPIQWDLLTLGETLLRLSPPNYQRLEQAHQLEIGIGGSELNVACFLARLGRKVTWVSRLPEGPLGRIVDAEARRHRVDTRYVRWVEGGRLGLMFYEAGPEPRTGRVLYDRKDSAASKLGFEDAPWATLIDRSRRVHLSGITPALGAGCRALVIQIAALAAACGKPVSYDLNFRATLTSPDEARAMLDAVAPHLQALFLAERDARHVLGFDESGAALAEAIARRYGMPIVLLSRPPGAEPSTLIRTEAAVLHAPSYEVQVLDRIGAGDSLVGGVLHGLLQDGLLQDDLDYGLRLGAYAAAMALATPGDINYIGPEDLAGFHAGQSGGLIR